MIKADLSRNFRGVVCPYNYVKTKLALEEMNRGQILEAIVDAGEPSRHVPQSVQQDGQTILNIVSDAEGFTHIFIQKTTDYE